MKEITCAKWRVPLERCVHLHSDRIDVQTCVARSVDVNWSVGVWNLVVMFLIFSVKQEAGPSAGIEGGGSMYYRSEESCEMPTSVEWMECSLISRHMEAPSEVQVMTIKWGQSMLMGLCGHILLQGHRCGSCGVGFNQCCGFAKSVFQSENGGGLGLGLCWGMTRGNHGNSG